jgi:hypothetical protein
MMLTAESLSLKAFDLKIQASLKYLCPYQSVF